MTELMAAERTIVAREVSEDERRFYFDHGWVYLPNLISPEDAELLRSEAERLMGNGCDIKSNVTRVGNERDKDLRGHQMNQFNIFNDPSKVSEPFQRIFDSPSVGHAAARFLSTPWTGPRKARRLANTLFVKGPQSTTGSGSTGWHQDRPYFPFDRDRWSCCGWRWPK